MICKFLSLFTSITSTMEQQQLKTGQFKIPKTRKQELFVLFTILVQKIILVRLLVLVHENITGLPQAVTIIQWWQFGSLGMRKHTQITHQCTMHTTQLLTHCFHTYKLTRRRDALTFQMPSWHAADRHWPDRIVTFWGLMQDWGEALGGATALPIKILRPDARVSFRPSQRVR